MSSMERGEHPFDRFDELTGAKLRAGELGAAISIADETSTHSEPHHGLVNSGIGRYTRRMNSPLRCWLNSDFGWSTSVE